MDMGSGRSAAEGPRIGWRKTSQARRTAVAQLAPYVGDQRMSDQRQLASRAVFVERDHLGMSGVCAVPPDVQAGSRPAYQYMLRLSRDLR